LLIATTVNDKKKKTRAAIYENHTRETSGKQQGDDEAFIMVLRCSIPRFPVLPFGILQILVLHFPCVISFLLQKHPENVIYYARGYAELPINTYRHLRPER